jgi:uncharacterized lipoprotein YddW (UPF0748 family)
MRPWNRLVILTASSFVSFSLAFSQAPPKREFRGAWIATVTNIDWPSSPGISSQVQQSQLTSLLDKLASAGINAVILQVRPACDAFYASPYEPWSSWLTGSQGAPPSSYYDPLQFAVQETHKRGMELHAWFNPYRVKLSATSPSVLDSTKNVSVLHPAWAIKCPDGYVFLDPGLQPVRDHVARVIADVVRRYDVDGVHMDDYFYPYPEHGFTTEDSATFRLNARGFAYPDSLAPWRRDNVNLLIKQVYDSIQAIKPAVKMGMSPFGIWQSKLIPGIAGTSAYDVLYCDAVAWLSGKYIDYIAPQLYWPFGGGQDYAKLQPWWASVANGRHLYTGNISSVGTSQIGLQIDFNRATHVQGSIIFSARSISGNSGGLADSLTYSYYASAAIIPVMAWKDTVAPNAPANLTASVNPTNGTYQLTWDPPAAATDGDTARRYLVYRFTNQTYQAGDLDNSANLLALTGQPTVVPHARIDSVNLHYYYAVSALDENNNESALSNVIPIGSTVVTPVLLSPANLSQSFGRDSYLAWYGDPSSLLYRVQVASSANFDPASIITTITTADTATQLGGLIAQTTYYWRVLAGNQGATGIYSDPWRFKTAWPIPPTLVSPLNATNASRTPTFVWNKGAGTSFRLRVTDVTTSATVIDVGVSDTTFLSNVILVASRVYSWTVSAINDYGASDWSAEGRFRPGQEITLAGNDAGVPSVYALSQNYPNPFNPLTTIRFAIPEAGPVKLMVYDLLGREVVVLVDEVLAPGFYTARFNGSTLSSGVYFYRLIASGYIETKKMQLIK